MKKVSIADCKIRHMNGQQVYEKMLIINCQQSSEKCKSKPHRSIISHLLEWLFSKGQKITTAGKDEEEREPVFTVGGNINEYSHYEQRYGNSSKN